MPFTEEQLQYMAQFSPHIRMMLKAKYQKQMEEDEDITEGGESGGPGNGGVLE